MRNKLWIAIGVLLLLATTLPAMAGTTMSMDFESPTYTLGAVEGQDGWNRHWGSAFPDMNVSNVNPISGNQSLVIDPGTYETKPIDTFDRTSISYLVKLGSGGDTFFYLGDTANYAELNYVRLSMDWGIMMCGNTNSPQYGSHALTVGNVYKVKIDFDFINHTGVVTLRDMTTSTNLDTINIPIKSTDSGGNPVTGSSAKCIMMYNYNGINTVDDINIYESPVVIEGPIDFESPRYELGGLDGQEGWTKNWSSYSGMNVTNVDPISGDQSVSAGANSFENKSINTFDKTTISLLLKTNTDSDTYIYLRDSAFADFCTVRLSMDWGVLYCASPTSPTQTGSQAIVAGDVYKVKMDFDFVNHTVVASLRNMTTSTSMDTISFTIPTEDSNWNPITGSSVKYFSMYNRTSSIVTIDDININKTPDTGIIDFESPTYSLGNLVGQDGWNRHWGTSFPDMVVSNVDPISGAQSLKVDAGTYETRPISTFNKTSISYVGKLGSTGDFSFYLGDIANYAELNFVRLSMDWNCMMCGNTNAPQYGTYALTAGDVYKVKIDFDFTTYTGVVSLRDMTTSTDMDVINILIPQTDSIGNPITGSSAKCIMMYGGAGFNTVDDINIFETPAPSAFTLTGNVTLGNYEGDITTVPVTIELNGTPYAVNLAADGSFTINDVAAGNYYFRVKASHWLAKAIAGVEVAGNTVVASVTLINGDVVDTNEVDFDDINAVRAAYGSFPGDDNWNAMADVDGTGEVDFSDINIVRSKYGEIGD